MRTRPEILPSQNTAEAQGDTMQTPDPPGTVRSPEHEMGVIDFLSVLLHWRRHIGIVVIATTLLALVASLLLPTWFKATTSLLPPKNQGTLGGISGISALLREVAPGATGKLGAQSNAYSYLAILKSRRTAEMVIQQFNLLEVYEIDDGSMEKAVREFQGNFDVAVSEEGSIVVSVFDRDAQRAADMANYVVHALNEISSHLGSSEARSTREFLEQRVSENRTALASAEDSLKSFQERHGIMFLPEDTKASAGSLSSLYARKLYADVELSILKRTAGTESPPYKQLEMQRDELARKLSIFPDLGMEMFRLYRDVLIQQKLMELLVPLYEQARIEEQKNIPVVLVLDEAVPPERKARPNRSLIVVSACVSSLIVSVGLALFITRFRVRRDAKRRPHG